MATLPISFPAGGGDSEGLTATQAQVLAGYTAITADSDGEPIAGTIPSAPAQTHYATLDDQVVVPVGAYTAGAQKLGALSTENFTAEEFRYGKTVTISNGRDAVAQITGTYTGELSSGQAAATAAQIRKGYSGFVNGSDEIKGSIEAKGATTYNVSASDRTIAAGVYLSGAQTIKGVTTSGISAANIKSGVTITVGDSDSPTRVANVKGTYTSVLSSGQTAMTAAQLMSGYSGYVNGGGEIKGSIAWKSGTSTSKKYHEGTAKSYTEQSSVRIEFPAAGYYNAYTYLYAPYTQFGTVAANHVYTGKTFTSKAGYKVTGTMANKQGTSTAAAPFSATVSDDATNSRVQMQVPAAGYYNTYSYLYSAYSSFGDATTGQVYTGKTFTSSAGFKATGAMAGKGGSSSAYKSYEAAVDADETNSRVRMKIPAAGYYNAYVYLYAAYSAFGNAAAGYVWAGKTFTSSAGYKATGTMANKGGSSDSKKYYSATVSADTTNSRVRMQIPATGYYNGYAYLYSAYSNFGAATAAEVLSSKTFTSSAGFKKTGSIASQGATTKGASTTDQTIMAASKYASGVQKVGKLTNSNLSAANILRGVTISISNGQSNVWSVSGSTSTLKRKAGTGTAGSTRVSMPSMGSRYYVDINPGFTPVYAISFSGLDYIRTGAKSGYYALSGGGRGALDANASTWGNLPFKKTQVRLPADEAGDTHVEYWIFGY